MTTHRFFTHCPISAGTYGELDADRARQLSRVLRSGVGTEIIVFDGSGLEARAELTTLTRESAEYGILQHEQPDREPTMQLSMGVALLKGRNFDLVVQKLTELGVTEIVPIAAERSIVTYESPGDWAKRAARLNRIIVEAAEQSGRVTLPVLHKPVTLATYLADRKVTVLLERMRTADPLARMPIGSRLALAVGPEGGWTDTERGLITKEAAGITSLGNLILRAETAAVVAAGYIMLRQVE